MYLLDKIFQDLMYWWTGLLLVEKIVAVAYFPAAGYLFKEKMYKTAIVITLLLLIYFSAFMGITVPADSFFIEWHFPN